MKIAIQGAAGSFHHIAAEHYFHHDDADEKNDYVYADTYTAVFSTLAAGVADVAVIAAENSMYGSILEAYDLLKKYQYPVVGEIVEHAHQNLVGFPDTKKEDIKRIYSNPLALAQCAHYLGNQFPNVEIVQHHDTAAAVETIKRSGDHSFAAIAGIAGAQFHDMAVLEAGIQDESLNFTRFWVVQPKGSAPDNSNKASLILTIPQEQGALHRALGVFADLGSDLIKIHSRPIPDRIKKYEFYIDIEITPAAVISATEMLTLQDCTLINLGNYRAAGTVYED